VLRLLREPDVRDRVVARGTETAQDFTLTRTIPQLESLYLDCLHHANDRVPRR
jgi:hypothetical protein